MNEGQTPESGQPNSEASSTLAKIEAGAYKVAKLEALPPAMPVSLRKPLADIDESEVEATLKELADYKAAQAAYEAMKADRVAMVELMVDQVRTDLQTEFGLEDNEKAKSLFTLCYSYAKGDLISLYGFYDDIHVLLK